MQTEQVLRLQRQAQLDAMTGVSLRHHFLGQLQRRLADPQGGRAALLIVRVCDLEALNLRAGREATDRLLCAVAHVLLTYVDRVAGALAGRLNGGDFALCLPVGGVALETATSLRDALAALPVLRTAGALAVVGGVDGLPHTTSSLALAQADAALARAEAGEGDGVAVDAHGEWPAGASGASAWRLQIAEALTQERAQLQHTPVLDREGRTLHLACTLHLQLSPSAAPQPPRLWLAWARRAHLLPRVDLLAVQLALQALAADGRPRCVRVAAASWSSPGFVLAVQALLQSAPTQARALAIELAEPASHEARDGLAAVCTAWAPCGVSLGVGHGRVMPPDLTALQATGIAFVSVAGDHLRGVAADAALRAYAQGWLQLVHDLGLLALLEGDADPRDLDVLWALGLDGAAAQPPAFQPAF
jgi:predicted signal transduction protein with EAL and GGDEF domain